LWVKLRTDGASYTDCGRAVRRPLTLNSSERARHRVLLCIAVLAANADSRPLV